MDLDWGNVPAWAAFISALVAVMFTWRALARERRRDADRELRDRQEQANQVAAWVSRRDGPKPGEPGNFYIELRNASDLPVYDVQIMLRDSVGGEVLKQVWWLGASPRDTPRVMDLDSKAQVRLDYIMKRAREQKDRIYYDLTLDFTDASGVRWHRQSDGRLVEINQDRKKQIEGK